MQAARQERKLVAHDGRSYSIVSRFFSMLLCFVFSPAVGLRPLIASVTDVSSISPIIVRSFLVMKTIYITL